MATQSSILCWGIPWTEEPGGYSLWSQRAGPTELLAPALSLHKQSIPGFPGDSAIKDLLAHAGDAEDMCTIPGSGRSTAGGNGTPLQYSCLGNPMDRGAWWATVHGTAELNTT